MERLQICDATTMVLALQDEISRSKESRYDHRLHGVLLVAKGNDCYQVADWLGQHPTTVERWVPRFEVGGLSGLQEGERPGRPRRLDQATWQQLEQYLRLKPRQLGHPRNLWDGKLLAHHLQQTYGVELGVRQCQRLFRAMGFRRRKPRPVIAHADPEAQRAFKKLVALSTDSEVDLWSADECHFQQHGSRCVMWVPPEETDPVLLHEPTRRSIALFGAVNLRGGQMHGMFCEPFNGDSFTVFLSTLLRRRARGRKMVVISDNAAYHKSAPVRAFLAECEARLQLLYLPPYSPELNPIERVWKLTRRLCTHNRYFPELAILWEAVSEQLRSWWRPNETLRRLCCIT